MLACLIVGFAALIAAGGMVAVTVIRQQEHSRWVEHTYQVQREIGDVQLLTERLEASRRGFLLSSSARARDTFLQSAAAEPATVSTLQVATADNPVQQRNVALLTQLLARHVALLGRSVALAVSDRPAAQAMFRADGSRGLTRAIRTLSKTMLEEENRLLEIRVQRQRDGIQRLFLVLIVTGALMVLVGIFSVMVIRRYTRDLVRSRDIVAGLNATLEERVKQRTQDLSRANEEIQRFAYIVSHDLRAPLVNVMGFTGELEAAAKPLGELVDKAEAEAPAILTEEARLAAREDLPEAIGFIRTSTQKMDRLINAILKLSREGKRVLTPESLDLVVVIQGITATLQHRLDQLGAEVSVRAPMPRIVADRLAVEQMLSNLIENAVKYLMPNVPGRIVVSGREDADRVVIEVTDNGRGIDPRDHDRIFDLFRRSGAQTQPGEGIGLAHVRALAYRLGGLVDCVSTLGEGATFRLSLPAEPPAPLQG